MVNVYVGGNVFDVEIEEQYVSDFRVWLKFVDGTYGVLELKDGVSFYPHTVYEMMEYAKGTDAWDFFSDTDSWLAKDVLKHYCEDEDKIFADGSAYYMED